MSVKRLKQAVPRVSAERVVSKGQSQFLGMAYGGPITKVPERYSYRNVNIIDKVAYKDVRPGTRLYTSCQHGTTRLDAYVDQQERSQIYLFYGGDLYRTNKSLPSPSSILFVSQQTSLATRVSTIVDFEVNAYLANSNALVKILYDTIHGVYYAYQINGSGPTVRITDDAETATKIYVYRYIYSLSRITYATTDSKLDRLSADVVLEHETPTVKVSGSDRDYGEVAFTTEIDNVAADIHTISTLTCPADNKEATHYSIYRTKNIGKASGGIDPVFGIGNNIAQYIWVDDAPIAKAFNISAIDGGTRTLTTAAGSNHFDPGDVGNVLTDRLGNVGTIEQYTDEHNVVLTAGYTLNPGLPNIAYGGGKIMRVSQSGTTITRDMGANFAAGDVGKPIFFWDGGMNIVASFTNANSVEGLWSETHAQGTATLNNDVAMTRVFNDTVKDNSSGDTQISINDRIASGQHIYIPPRFYAPLPNGDTITVGHGYVVVATKNETLYYYAQIGSKRYWAGIYRPDHQYDEAASPIRHMIRTEGKVHIWSKASTENLLLNVSSDVGLADVGEFVSKLRQPYMLDNDVGCHHWQTIRRIPGNRFMLLTTEPLVRMFDGERYGGTNWAVNTDGSHAVIEYLKNISPGDSVIASYSPLEGYKLYVRETEFS